MGQPTCYQQLAEAIGAGESKYIPNVFQILVNEPEAQVLLAASPPATVEEIGKKTGIAASDIEAMIDPLFKKGLLFKSKKPDGVRYYRVRSIPQLHDATAVSPDAPPKMFEFWRIFMAHEWPHYMAKLEAVIPQAVMRVIPVNVSIDTRAQIMAFEDVKQALEEARSLAVTACSCRAIDGACHKPVEVCIQFNKAADYAIERGTGRRLDVDEAMAIMKQCEDEGLIHVGDNRRSVGHVICNCCSDCCMNWPSIREGVGKFVTPSRFCATVDADLCSGCETCLDRCYFDAISMEGENNTARIDAEKCMGCGLCLVACPETALSLEEVRPADFIPV
jgi:ferredoxin